LRQNTETASTDLVTALALRLTRPQEASGILALSDKLAIHLGERLIKRQALLAQAINIVAQRASFGLPLVQLLNGLVQSVSSCAYIAQAFESFLLRCNAGIPASLGINAPCAILWSEIGTHADLYVAILSCT